MQLHLFHSICASPLIPSFTVMCVDALSGDWLRAVNPAHPFDTPPPSGAADCLKTTNVVANATLNTLGFVFGFFAASESSRSRTASDY